MILTGLLGIFIIEVMGFVRESARAPFTFSQIIPVAGGTGYTTPLAIENILGVWFVSMIVIVVAFILVSRATAHHPEKAEEIE